MSKKLKDDMSEATSRMLQDQLDLIERLVRVMEIQEKRLRANESAIASLMPAAAQPPAPPAAPDAVEQRLSLIRERGCYIDDETWLLDQLDAARAALRTAAGEALKLALRAVLTTYVGSEAEVSMQSACADSIRALMQEVKP